MASNGMPGAEQLPTATSCVAVVVMVDLAIFSL